MRFATTLLLLTTLPVASAHAAELTPKTFERVKTLIEPQPGESLWRHIPWETRLSEARKKAAQQGKPLLIWAGGGSAPLGGC